MEGNTLILRAAGQPGSGAGLRRVQHAPGTASIIAANRRPVAAGSKLKIGKGFPGGAPVPDNQNTMTWSPPSSAPGQGLALVALRHCENVTRPADQVRLSERLAGNRALLTVSLLKDDLKTPWHSRHAGCARRCWDAWYPRAMRSRIEPPKAFARRLNPCLPGILAHCRWPLGTNLIEGMNNNTRPCRLADSAQKKPHPKARPSACCGW